MLLYILLYIVYTLVIYITRGTRQPGIKRKKEKTDDRRGNLFFCCFVLFVCRAAVGGKVLSQNFCRQAIRSRARFVVLRPQRKAKEATVKLRSALCRGARSQRAAAGDYSISTWATGACSARNHFMVALAFSTLPVVKICTLPFSVLAVSRECSFR